jgi:hypothetical protein
MNLSFETFLLYLIASCIVTVCYCLIAFYWIRLRGSQILTTPAMRKLLSMMLVVTGLSFILGAFSRFYQDGLVGIDLAVRIALAAIAVITAIVVVQRSRALMRIAELDRNV